MYAYWMRADEAEQNVAQEQAKIAQEQKNAAQNDSNAASQRMRADEAEQRAGRSILQNGFPPLRIDLKANRHQGKSFHSQFAVD